MPQFTYSKFGKSWGVSTVVDESEYTEALALFAGCFNLPTQSIEYLLQYGVNQTTQDSMAQPASSAKADGSDVAAASVGAADKRWDSIVNGNAGVRAGGGRTSDPVESEIRLLAVAAIKAAVKAKGKTMPKGEALTTLRDQLIAKNRAAFESKAKARLAEANTIEVEV